MPQFPSLGEDYRTKVLIIGGGITGVLCAQALASAGVDYLLVEQGRICGGVTENTTAKITSQHGFIYDKLIRQFGVEGARQYYEANEAAIGRYRALAENCEFETRDNYVYTMDQALLEKELAALEKIGARAECVMPGELPFPVAGAVRFPRQAQFHPLQFISAISKNLNIREHTKILTFDGRRCITADGSITAEKIIVATHFPLWNKHGLYPLKMYQHRSYVLGMEDGGTVKGMYVDENKKGWSMRSAGELLLLGGGSHRTGKAGGGWAELERIAAEYYPQARIRYRWATQDCMTLDGVAYIGRYAKSTPNLFVATGFNKWGMSSAMVAAELLKDLVLEQENPYEALFSPSRSMLCPQLAVNALHAAGNLLTPTVPRCPHLGCALKWNKQERSWDCPCHGSRFSESGKRLDGPATDDMKQ